MKMARGFQVAAVVGLLMLNSPVAMAKSATSPDGGAVASTSGATGSVRDAKCDDRAAKGKFSYSGGTIGELPNKSGCGSTASKTYGGTITAVQACTIKTAYPDSCSSWV